VHPARWCWLQERRLLFEFHLRARFADLGRTVDGSAFWRRVFESIGLAQAMIWLDREISVP